MPDKTLELTPNFNMSVMREYCKRDVLVYQIHADLKKSMPEDRAYQVVFNSEILDNSVASMIYISIGHRLGLM